jgi:putative PIN family toxin of toxin-antitoxin system
MNNPTTGVVVDTGVLISRLLTPSSTAAQATELAIRQFSLLFSSETLAELQQVLTRKKFDRYSPPPAREIYYRWIASRAKIIKIAGLLRACRDPHDDMILDVAETGSACVIGTGDNDLLSMLSWKHIPIVGPTEFLTRPF